MKKNILEEIYRTQKLMGVQTRKPLVTEQLSVLIKAIQAGGKNMDDLIELVTKGVAKGEVIGSKEIDELVEQVKSTGKYTDDEIEIFRNFLKKPKVTAHIQSGEGLFTKIDNLTDDITEMEAELLSRLAKLSDNEIEKIISSLVMKSADNITNLPLYLKLETAFTNQLDNILNDSTKYINSIDDDIYKQIDDYLDNRFKIADDASDVAKETNKKWLNEFKSKVRENPKLTQKIKELQDAGKIGPRQTPAVVDDVVDDTADDVIDDAAEEAADDADIPVIEWGPMTDSAGNIRSSWAHRLAFKFCDLGFCEALVDLVRSTTNIRRRTPSQWFDDTANTISELETVFTEMNNLPAGSPRIKEYREEINGLVRRLKSNTKFMSTKEFPFEARWEDIKAYIRRTIDDENTSTRFIDYIENKAKTSSGLKLYQKGQGVLKWQSESIGEFITLMNKHANKGSVLKTLNNINPLKSDWWRELFDNTYITDYLDELALVAEKSENKIVSGFSAVVTKLLIDFFSTLLKKTINYFTFGTFRSFGKMILKIRAGNLTNLGALKRFIELYIQITIISNVVEPLIDFGKNLYAVDQELGSLKREMGKLETDKQTPYEILLEDIKQRIPIFGNEFEWNPFYNPVPNTDLSGLGFQPAPLPNFIADEIVDMLRKFNFLAANTTKKDVTGEKETEIMSKMSEILKENTDESELPNIAYENQYDLILTMLDSNRWDNFSKDEIEFLKSRIGYEVFYPADYRKILQKSNPEAYAAEYKNIDVKSLNDVNFKIETLGKNVETTIIDNSGNKYIVLVYDARGKKLPKDVNLDAKAPNSNNFPESNKFLNRRVVWVKPSISELRANSTRTYHNLREFLNLNYKPKK